MATNTNCNETIENYVKLIDDIADALYQQLHTLQNVIGLVRANIEEGELNKS